MSTYIAHICCPDAHKVKSIQKLCEKPYKVLMCLLQKCSAGAFLPLLSPILLRCSNYMDFIRYTLDFTPPLLSPRDSNTMTAQPTLKPAIKPTLNLIISAVIYSLSFDPIHINGENPVMIDITGFLHIFCLLYCAYSSAAASSSRSSALILGAITETKNSLGEEIRLTPSGNTTSPP